ncbi:hypothetical protein NDU88_002875 [Pleurodeles waltl]|uniref:Uncharacterized protein n=1 Tax=Pleurodeles waltl TaxID=8319 RepID=A0AAV7LDQ1_PLEWA|nr:hypothetical protein NDU88_002875 [Pleurodeles waltl]
MGLGGSGRSGAQEMRARGHCRRRGRIPEQGRGEGPNRRVVTGGAGEQARGGKRGRAEGEGSRVGGTGGQRGRGEVQMPIAAGQQARRWMQESGTSTYRSRSPCNHKAQTPSVSTVSGPIHRPDLVSGPTPTQALLPPHTTPHCAAHHSVILSRSPPPLFPTPRAASRMHPLAPPQCPCLTPSPLCTLSALSTAPPAGHIQGHGRVGRRRSSGACLVHGTPAGHSRGHGCRQCSPFNARQLRGGSQCCFRDFPAGTVPAPFELLHPSSVIMANYAEEDEYYQDLPEDQLSDVGFARGTLKGPASSADILVQMAESVIKDHEYGSFPGMKVPETGLDSSILTEGVPSSDSHSSGSDQEQDEPKPSGKRKQCPRPSLLGKVADTPDLDPNMATFIKRSLKIRRKAWTGPGKAAKVSC